MAIPKDGRVLVPDYDPREALRPAPIPSSTYVRPAEPQVDNTFASIANALGGFASFATGLGKQDTDKADREEEDAFKAGWALKTQAERDADVAAGRVPNKFKRVAGIISGSAKANEYNRSIPGIMEGYDSESGESKAQFLERTRQEAAKGLDADQTVGFAAGTQAPFETARDNLRKVEDDEAALKRGNEFVGYLRNGVDEGVTKGAPAADIVRRVFTDAAISPKLTGLEPSQQNSVFYALAQEWAAEGRHDLIEEMINYDRPGVGKFSDTIEWRDKFNALRDEAKNKDNETNLLERAPQIQTYRDAAASGTLTIEQAREAGKKFPSYGEKYFTDLYYTSEDRKADIAAKKSISEANTQAMNGIEVKDMQSIMGGTFDQDDRLDMEVPEVGADGITKMKTVTWDDRKQRALKNIKRYGDRLRENGATDEQVQAMEMSMYAANNLVNPQWKAQMEGVAIEGSKLKAAKGNTSELQITGELYRNLYQQNTGLAKSHVGESPRSEVWFETYRMARESGKEGGDATVLAAQAVEDLDSGVKFKVETTLGRSPQDKAMTQLTLLFDDAWLGKGGAGALGLRASTEVVKRAEFYMQASKMTEPQALKAAAEWVKKTHVVIGNDVVFAGYDGMPKDFKPRVETFLADKFGEDARDHSIMELDGGRTYLVMDPNGMPVFAPGRDEKDTKPRFMTFTVNEVTAYGKTKDDEAVHKKIDEANEEKEKLGLGDQSMTSQPIDPSADDRDILIRTVAAEAISEGEVGMAAVAHVIVNRTRDTRYPEELRGVMLQANAKGYHQFSAWNANSKTGNDLVLMKTTDPRYLKAAEVVDKVLSGETPDPTGGAVNYAALGSLSAKPKWWAAATAERGGRELPLGRHSFTGKIKPRAVATEVETGNPNRAAGLGETPTKKFAPLGTRGFVVASRATHPVDMDSLKPDMKKGLTQLSAAWGEELSLTSANRDLKTNTQHKGAKTSAHMTGSAVDVDVDGWPIAKRLKFLELASKLGFKGLGVYRSKIHIDIAGLRAWGPSLKIGSVPGWARGVIARHLNSAYQ